jgi:outer membrane protein insertion porin family
MALRYFALTILILSTLQQALAQETGLWEPKDYTIAEITVVGNEGIDSQAIILISGLKKGEEITLPGYRLTDAYRNLWDTKAYTDIDIIVKNIHQSAAYLEIKVEEIPRVTKFHFTGVTKNEYEDLIKLVDIYQGQGFGPNDVYNMEQYYSNYFTEQGHLYNNVSVIVSEDSTTYVKNGVSVEIKVNKGERIRIGDISFQGHEPIQPKKLRKLMRDTKKYRWYNIFGKSKFIPEAFGTDRKSVEDYYRLKGFADAKVNFDTTLNSKRSRLTVNMQLDQGQQYVFRNITYSGNAMHSSAKLKAVLGIKKGDPFSELYLRQRISQDPIRGDLSSLYMEKGHLFFNATPSINVDGDSVDVRIKIEEGRPAVFGPMHVVGNNRTKDHVILRELLTYPGDTFSRSAIVRSQQRLMQLGYFAPEGMNVIPKSDPKTGDVELFYHVEEQITDRFELSGGWNARGGAVGTLGFTFNNFSTKDLFKKGLKSFPAGDGQKLSIRAQSGGKNFSSINMSFVEPWFGGKKPNTFSVSTYHSVRRADDDASLKVTGIGVGLSHRLKWPDDYFVLHHKVGFQQFNVKNYNLFSFTDGQANNLNYEIKLTRNSLNRPIFPTSGGKFKLSGKFALPVKSIAGFGDISSLTEQQKYNWLEYHKWKITGEIYTSLSKPSRKRKLVLKTKAGLGVMGGYNKEVGAPPFERFYMGGTGQGNFGVEAQEFIGLRGYDIGSISSADGDVILSKYTMELRYPLSLSSAANIFVLGFLEAGNSWSSVKNFQPFDLKRSVGLGLRLNLPMFGQFGLDYGWGLDGANPNSGNFQFTIGFNIGDL